MLRAHERAPTRVEGASNEHGVSPAHAIPIPGRVGFGSSGGEGFKPFVDFRVGWAKALVVQFVFFCTAGLPW